MAEDSGRSQRSGRAFVCVLLALCIGCGVWCIVSHYRMKAANRLLRTDATRLTRTVELATELVSLVGGPGEPTADLTEAEFNTLVLDTATASDLAWKSINQATRDDGRKVEYIRYVDATKVNVENFLKFLVMLRQRRSDLAIDDISLQSTSKSRKIWNAKVKVSMTVDSMSR